MTVFGRAAEGAMSTSALLSYLAGQNVEVWAEGERLRFRAPRGQLTEDLRRLLERHKSELLALLREGEPEAASSGLPQIVPAPDLRYDPFPLTDLQQAYWVGRDNAFEMGNVAPHFYLEADLPDLDATRFNEVLVALIERHDMLRGIVLPEGYQRILPAVPRYVFEVSDLTGRKPSLAEAELAAVRHRMSHQVFPTDLWPLFEIRASRWDGGVRLHMSFDLLIGDVWSFQIFFRELFLLYRDPQALLPPLELSFRDYVVAELAFQSSERYRRSLEYWESRLPSLPPPPELSLAIHPTEITVPRFTRRSGRLEPQAWRALKECAQRMGVTPSGVLLAAFSEVLRAWSKEPRFTLNLTFFNRLPFHPQINDIMGDFSATLLLAVENPEDETFEGRAVALQRQLWRDLEHVHVSGVRVLRELARFRRTRLVAMPVVFTSALRASQTNEEGPAEAWQPAYGISQTPQVWLDHRVTEQADALTFSWDVVEDLFPTGIIETMFEAYCGLLARLVRDEAWKEAPVLLPSTQRDLYAAINATSAPLFEALLHEPFAAQAAQWPLRPAVIAPECVLTYGELAWRAQRLGQTLGALGARPNHLIAVVMEKGWEQVVAVLGILESGAAYLPIDAGLPPERIRNLLRRGEVKVAVTQPRFLKGLEWPAGVETVAVEADRPGEDGEPPLPSAATLDDLAYVIFTSGSTGEPKGVMIDHRGALNTVADVNRRFAVGPDDRILALSSLSFDLSVYDIFGPLSAGGTVVFPEAWAVREPDRWARSMAEAGVTIWNSVPALLEMLVEYLEGRGEKGPGSLRLAMLSGDWIPVTLPDRVRSVWPETQVIGLGGATEASIWSIVYPIGRIEEFWKSIPYGRPMVNQQFHVLSDRLEPRPVWVPGQLYIGGVGVAKGYWRDEENTAASFVRHPRTREVLYRTGDLGRWLPEGQIEFLGREDLQVKIRGHRVELGEIEAVLAQHSMVRAGVVKAVGELRGRKRLVAYVVPVAEPPTPGDLAAFLRGKLPEYMVPSAFVVLNSLPLTPNGKVDRGALPDPAEVDRRPEERETPRTAGLAEAIAGIVAGVLGTEPIDPQAQLMDLGMVSVDIIRIANRMEKELGFRPRIDDFYQLSTCKALAEAFSTFWQASREPAAPAEPGTSERSLWTSFGLVLDPAEREAFKRQQKGVRCDLQESRRVELLDLPAPDVGRRTHRHFSSRTILFREISGLLSSLRQLAASGAPKYLYPSAGGLYPVQVYLHVKAGRVEGLEGGSYYYDPGEHSVVAITPGVELDRTIHAEFVNRSVFDESAFSIFLIAEAAAVAPLYGARGRDFCLLEAGAMLQLLMTTAAGHGLGLCPVGTVDFAGARHLFGLLPTQELAHTILGGAGDGLDARPEERALPGETPAASGRNWPLSSSQRQLWFLHQLDPDSPYYNSPVAVRLAGRLDVAALARALAEIVRRHEILRARFPALQGEPVQVIAPPGPVPLPLCDLSALPEAVREPLVRRLAAEEVCRPLDVENGPVFRFQLFQLDREQHVVVVTLHHIVSDFWSLAILTQEVAVLYGAFASRLPSPLPELPLQYADFAVWQNRWLQGEERIRKLAYWKERLAGAPLVLSLPTERPRSPVQSFRGASRLRSLDRELVSRVKRLGHQERATPFMTLLAAFSTLLYCSTGQEDIVIGSPVANRHRADFEGLIGLFVNLLVFRCDLSGQPSFREVLSRIREVTREAQENQELPFGVLVEELRPQRSLAYSPLFQVSYTFLDVRQSSFELPGLTLSPLGIDNETTQFDLVFKVEDGELGMNLVLEYSTDLFEEATIQTLLAHLERLLEVVTARPDVGIGDLRELLADLERRERLAARQEIEEARLQRLKTVRRQAIRSGAGEDGRDSGGPEA